MEKALRPLKGGKSPGIDNVPAELAPKRGGPKLLKTHHNHLPEELGMQGMDSIPNNTPSEERQPKTLPELQNYRSTSLISHPSNFMLRVILNRLEGKAEEDYRSSHNSISIGGRPLCDVRYADDLHLTGGNEAELQGLTTRLETSGAYGIGVGSETSKILVNSTSQPTSS